jgi:large subunit ribosomal protein L25
LELIEINAKTRTSTGNGPARVLRREGRIPAILYGPTTEPVKLSVEIRDLELAFKKTAATQALINLIVHDGETYTKPVMVKELQTHPTTEALLHADFYEIDLSRKISVSVPILPVGKSIGVEEGGLLQSIRRELEVICLPNKIPEVIEVDVTELAIGDSLHVKSIPLPEGVEVQTETDFTVLTVVSAKVEVEAEVTEDELLEGEELEAVEGEGDGEGAEDTQKEGDAEDA